MTQPFAVLALLLEVLDKLPGPYQLWGMSTACGALGFALCWRWPRTAVAVPVLLAAGLLAWANVAILTDPFVGPAARVEGGARYTGHVLGAAALTLLLPCVAIVGRRRRVAV